MDIKNTRQFLPGYHSITGYETVRIRGGHDRYCQARDAATDMGRMVFHLGVTKRQLDRWKLPLREGMTICIEPMIFEHHNAVRVLKDGWTVVAKDKGLTAHYENTVAVTKDGCEILTKI